MLKNLPFAVRKAMLLLPFLAWSNIVTAQIQLPADAPQKETYVKAMAHKALAFTENKGQVADSKGNLQPDILFTAVSGPVKLFITGNSINYQFTKYIYPKGYQTDLSRSEDAEKQVAINKKLITQTHRFTLSLEGANQHPVVQRSEANLFTENFYLGHCPQGILNVHNYNRVVLKEVYPGIDWVIYSNGNGLKYEFVLQPNADPSLIQLKIKDADNVDLSKDGGLVIKTSLGEIKEAAPVSFAGKDNIPTAFRKNNDGTIGFDVVKQQNSMLTIDPIVNWSTYYGGPGGEDLFGCAADHSGNVYISGSTSSTSGIASGGFQTTAGGAQDVYIVKFNSTGSRLWATYYGSTGADFGFGLAIDGSDNVLATGYTTSTSGMSTPGAAQFSYGGGVTDGYVLKCNSAGVRQWATYYGGSILDYGRGCAADAAGNVFISGETSSTNGIGIGGHQNTLGGSNDAMLAKYNSAGVFQWGTYYGGSFGERGTSCVVDPAGNVYLSGYTGSSNNISFNGHQNTPGGGFEAFLAKFNTAGARQWGTYYGGEGDDKAVGIVADAAGNVYLCGMTYSTIGIAYNGYQNTNNGPSLEGFIVKFNSSCVRQWGTYYGTSGQESGEACTIDAADNVYLVGYTNSVTGLASAGFQNSSGGGNDAWVVKFSSQGDRNWASYFGGAGNDLGEACAVNTNGNLFIAGQTTSTSGIASGGFQNTLSGGGDAFLVSIGSPSIVTSTVSPTVVCEGASVTVPFTTIGTFLAGNVFTAQLSDGTGNFDTHVNIGTLTSTTAGTINAVIPIGSTSGGNQFRIRVISSNPVDTGSYNLSDLTVYPGGAPAVAIAITAGSQTGCAGSSITFTATPTKGGTSPSYQWKVNGVNAGTNSPTFTSTGLANNDVVTVVLTSNAPCLSPTTATSNSITITITSSAPAGVSIAVTAGNQSTCIGSSVTFTATPVNGGTSPSYQWKVNGVNAGTNAPTFTSTSLANNDVVTVLMTSNSGCASPTTATSTGITMTVNPFSSPSVSIALTSGTQPICPGAPVSFTATPVNGGATPSYQWRINGVNQGTNSATFTTSALNNNDVVSVVMTSSYACASPATATSAVMTMSVTVYTTPSVSVATTSGNGTCQGSPLTFTATPTNGGTTPFYQWKVNGVNQGTNSPVFTTSGLISSDVVTVTMTTSLNCSLPASVTSSNASFFQNFPSTASVTINSPGTIFCAGASVTFTSFNFNGGTTPIYQWKVNGVNAGTNSSSFTTTTLANNDVVTLQMTSTATCIAPATVTSNTITVTINNPPTPAVTINMFGTQPFCAGTSVSFSSSNTNCGFSPVYQWKVNGVNAGTNTSTFTSSTLANNDIITLEITPGGGSCLSTSPAISNSITMQINTPIPPSVTIAVTSGSQTSCAGNSITFTATVANAGGFPTLQWKVNGVNSGFPSSSTTFIISSLANGDIVTVVVTPSSGTCSSTAQATSNPITITITPPPPATISIAVTSGNQVMCAGNAITFTATTTNAGTFPNYQWKVNGVNAGFNSSSFFPSGLVNNDVVTCVVTPVSGACISNVPVTSNSITMTVNAYVTASVSVSASQTIICAGTSVTFTATPTGGGAAPTYQWKVNNINVTGTGNTYTTSTLVNNDAVTVIMTSNAPCVFNSPATNFPITMIVTPALVPSVSAAITAGSQTTCAGSSVTFTATPTNGGMIPIYQWKVNGVNAGTNSATFTSTTLANNDVVTVVMTSNASCISPTTATSAGITITITAAASPSVAIAITTGSQTTCAGSSVTFTATPTNGGTTPVYQWKVNGVNAGTNSPTFTSTTLANNDVVTIVMTSNASCVSPTTATSTGITMTITALVSPSVSIAITTGSQTICAGTSVTFTATPVNGGAAPSYQWKINGVNAGTNSATFTSATLANGETITVVMTSNAACISTTTATSAGISMTVNSSVIPAVSIAITSGSQTTCTGSSVTFTATATNGGTIPVYQWKINGVNAGTNSVTFTSTTLANNDVVTVVMTSNAACASPITATSTGITMTITASAVPAVSVVITAGSQTTCAGSSVTFTATPTNGGTTPAYQWKVNGVNAGTNAATFTSTTLVNNDIVTVVMTSNSGCASPLTATSTGITMTITATVVPTVSIAITAGTQTTCAGASITFTATAANGGTTPAYQWKVNGVNAGTNAPTFTSTTLANSDVVTVVMTSNSGCAGPLTATSTGITMTVNAATTPSVSIAITTGNQTTCTGASVTFTATPLNGGITPIYQWKVNGVNQGTNSPTFTSTTLASGNIVTLVMTSNAVCASPLTATSNGITMTVNPLLTPAVAIAITAGSQATCTGSSVTFTATPTNGGTTPNYQWQINGINAGTNAATFTSSTLANNDNVTVIMTSNAVCASPLTATSTGIIMTIGSAVAPSVAIAITAGSQSTCTGSSVTFTATPINGGATPAYQWKVNGVNTGTNAAIFTSTTLTNNDVITVVMTSSSSCASPTTATSAGITMTIGSAVAPSVAIAITAGSQSTCTGSSVTFMATATNGGATPAYQWKVNGVNAGTNSPTFTSTTLANNDVVTVVMTSSSSCASPTTATSTGITMTIGSAVAPSVAIAITAGSQSTCTGSSVTFTATPTNGGATPAYQWKVNGVNAGINSPTFTSTILANNDVITVVMTSSSSCASPTTATSAGITMTIGSAVAPSITIAITAGSQSTCTGSSVTFTATPTNGGATPAYQWKVNGVNAGTNAATFTSTTLANNDVVTVVMTSSSSCASPTIATSAGITMTIGSAIAPSVAIAITAGSQSTCTGSAVTFTATPTNGGATPAYQWKVNGVNAGTNSATFTSTTLANNDVITVVMTSSSSCASPTNATSTGITMTIGSAVAPSVTIAITAGSQSTCTGSSVTFTATATNGGATPAYQWKVNGVNAGTNAATFTSTTLANNNVISVVMTSSSSCASPTTATSTGITMTIGSAIAPSVAIAITAGSQSTCTGSAVTFTATPTNGGATPVYQWKVNGVNAGTNAATFTSTTLANNDVVTVVMTSSSSCASPTTATSAGITMTIGSAVAPSVAIAITAGSQSTCTGSSVTFTATPVNGGTTPSYQWKVNGVNAGTNAVTFTSTTLANNDVVTVIMTSSSSCASPTTATSTGITMTIGAAVAPSVASAITAGSQSTCTGSSVTFTATPVNGGTTPSYQWKVNGVNAGTNAPTFTSTTLANNDVITVVMTSSSSCASPTTATSAGITMTIGSAVAPSVAIAITAGSQSTCTGSSVTFTATSTNGGATPAYQWKVNGVNAGTNSATFTSTTLANTDVVTVVMTSNASCVSPLTATSPGITMTVNAAVTPTVSIVASQTTFCTGTSVTFTATPVNGGTTPAYQWKVNGINAGTNAQTFTSTTLANNDIVTVVMTSNASCISSATATSNAITVTVTSTVTPSVSIAITTGTQITCSGTSISFTATPVNGGSAPAYQWKVNGINAGTNAPVFTSSTLANNDVVTVIMTSNAGCLSTANATSNSIQMGVTTTVTPSATIAITTGSQIICAGTSVTFTATPANGGTNPVYQWKVNGVNAGTNAPTFTSATLANNDNVTVDITSNAACVNPATATSNTIQMTVNPMLTPAVSIAITTGNQNTCNGSSVTFTATPVNGGAAPLYQWEVNGVNAGINSPTFTSAAFANNDVITVVLTSNAGCLASNNPVSNAITMTINTNLTPAVSIAITGGAQIVCAGTNVTFTATPINGGTAPAYQWKINGVNAGTNAQSFSSNTLANGDIVTVVLTSNEACLATNNVVSNSITMTVNPNLTPVASIAITAGAQTICAGSSVTFTATPTNGGTVPAYQWKVNGVNAGTNSPTFTSTTLANNGVVTVVLTSNEACLATNNVLSNGITMTVNPLLTPTVSIVAAQTTICAGATATFTATPVNGGSAPSYQWKINGTNAGANNPTFSVSTLANGDVVTVVLTSNATCLASNNPVSNAITMTVNPLLTPSVTITTPKTQICKNDFATFTATTVNGGAAPNYQWKINGANAGSNSPTFTTGTLVNGDIVTVVLNSSEPCLTVNNVISNGIRMTVSPLPVITATTEHTEILQGGETQLHGTSTEPVSIYAWTPTTSLNNSSIADPIAAPDNTVLYKLQVTTTFGCKGSATVGVKVVPGPQVANTFTPNGDGIHDFWEIKNLDTYPLCRIHVFTRTGQLIFESIGYKKPWDGNYKGKAMPFDTYYYILELNNRISSKPITGYVTIVK